MSKNLARYFVVLIANDLSKHRDLSSYTCEFLEDCLIKGEYDKVERLIKNHLADMRSIPEIIEESEKKEEK